MDIKRSLQRVVVTCAVGFLVAMCSCRAGAVASSTPNVTIYMSPNSGVLDLEWDMSPDNLELQLRDLGLSVTAAVDGQPLLTGDSTPDAYVIPYQGGNVFYAYAEDMQQVADFVAAGGLVILLNAATGEGASTREFVSKAFNLKGDWYMCRSSSTSKSSTKRFALSHLGDGLELSTWAPFFLPHAEPVAVATSSAAATTGAVASTTSTSSTTPWPRRVEDFPRVISTHTLCIHEDTALISRPLYTVRGDEMRVAAQAFSRVGSPGAVVWLGYNWRDGPLNQWGELIRKLVNDFTAGVFRAPSEAEAGQVPRQIDMADQVLEAAAAAAGAGATTADLLADTMRILLEGTAPGVYPPPPSPSPPTHSQGSDNSNGNANGNSGNNGQSGNNGNGNNGNGSNGNGNHGNGNTNAGGSKRRSASELAQAVRRLLSDAASA